MLKQMLTEINESADYLQNRLEIYNRYTQTNYS